MITNVERHQHEINTQAPIGEQLFQKFVALHKECKKGDYVWVNSYGYTKYPVKYVEKCFGDAYFIFESFGSNSCRHYYYDLIRKATKEEIEEARKDLAAKLEFFTT